MFYSNPKEDKVIMFDGALTNYQECPDIDEKRIIMIANFFFVNENCDSFMFLSTIKQIQTPF